VVLEIAAYSIHQQIVKVKKKLKSKQKKKQGEKNLEKHPDFKRNIELVAGLKFN